MLTRTAAMTRLHRYGDVLVTGLGDEILKRLKLSLSVTSTIFWHKVTSVTLSPTTTFPYDNLMCGENNLICHQQIVIIDLTN